MPESDHATEPALQRWGLGDVAIGFVVAQIASTLVYAIVLSGGRYAPRAPAGIGAAVGEVAGRIATGRPPGISEPIPLYLTALLQIPLWAGLLFVPLWATRKKGAGPVHDLGLRLRPVDVPAGIAVGVGSQLFVVSAVYWVLFKFTGTQDVSAAARELTDRATTPLGVVLLLLIVGVGAPIAEEVFFRGLLQRSLLKRQIGWHWAVLVTALLFAASHLQPLQFPALFVFGLILGVMAHRSDRLGPAMVAHLAFNITAAALLVTGRGL